MTGARVRQITTDNRGLATGAVYVDRSGQHRHQPASVVLLAANGIGTPRLLLLSAGGRFPDGLANRSGLVGKQLMMHPFGTVIGLFERHWPSWQGHWGQSLQCMQFYETGADRDFLRGAKWGLQPTGGPLGAALGFGGDPVWGAALHERVITNLGHSIMWGIIGEDLPDENNRVTVDTDLLDSDGIPAPRIQYRVSENSRRLLKFHAARAAESLTEAGAYETVVTPQVRGTGWHLLGTTRMGDDPESSVVDPWCRSHDVENLYVIDGSVLRDIRRRQPHSHDRRPGPAGDGAPDRTAPGAAGAMTDSWRPEDFDEAFRARLARIADVLVPAYGEMPSASSVGISGELLDRSLRARPDLAEACTRAVIGCANPPSPEALEQLADQDPDGFGALMVLVLGGYYMSADVRKLLHYSGQEALRIDIGELPAYIEEALLDEVIDRGPIYRRTPLTSPQT